MTVERVGDAIGTIPISDDQVQLIEAQRQQELTADPVYQADDEDPGLTSD